MTILLSRISFFNKLQIIRASNIFYWRFLIFEDILLHMRNYLGWVWTVIIALLAIYYMIVSIHLLVSSRRRRLTGYILYAVLSALYVGAFLTLRNQNAGGQGWLSSVNFAYIIGFTILHILVTVFFLVDDIRRVITWIVLKGYGISADRDITKMDISRSRFLTRAGWIGGIVLFSSFFIGIKNKYNYKIRRVKLKPGSSGAALAGLKIVHISDIHSGSFDDLEAVQRGIDMINEEQPDLILFTGDIVNNKTDEIYPVIDTLKQMKAGMGIYATLGNHDYGDYWEWNSPEDKVANLEELKRVITEDLGWRLLMNEHVQVERNNDHFTLLGVENWGNNMSFPRYGKLKEAYAGLESDTGYKILLSHDPSHWDAQIRPEYPDIDLTLAGHTHGMQFGVELSWFHWSPVQYVYKQWAGLYTQDKQKLYVNRGFGFLGYKGRVGILPEITVIEFE